MEEEKGGCLFVPEDTGSKTGKMGSVLDELMVEDEAREIRQKMMKARRKRQRSTCVSFCD